MHGKLRNEAEGRMKGIASVCALLQHLNSGKIALCTLLHPPCAPPVAYTQMRRELRTEAMEQLKDVASVFVMHLKSSKIAHAEVQCSAPEVRACSGWEGTGRKSKRG